MPIIVLKALLAAMLISSIHAENEPIDWFYRAWQTEHGLPDNSVTGVAQGHDGYLWVATKGGLMRFNGTEFTSLPLHNVPNLPSRAIRSMFLDRSGQVWIAMERGPIIRIGESSFHAFTAEDGIVDKVVTSMTQDGEGRIWIAFTSGVYRIESDVVTRFGTEYGIPVGRQPSLACDTEGQVWLANSGKLGRVSEDGFELVHDYKKSLSIAAARDSGIWLTVDLELMRGGTDTPFRTVATLPKETNVNTIYEDHQGAAWLGSHGMGLIRFKDGSLEKVATSFGWVDSITQDRDGNIWAGTIGGGLNLIKPRVVELYEKPNDLPFTSVRSVAYDTSGRVWAASQAGHLAYKESGTWHNYSPGGDQFWVNCVVADASGGLWIGTRENGLKRLDIKDPDGPLQNTKINETFVRSLMCARNGDIWVASDTPYRLHRIRDGQVKRITHTGPIKALRAMAEGSDGTIWIGSADGRLLKVKGNRLVDEQSAEEMQSIRTLHATDDGSLWIGYAGEGLGHIRNGKYTRVTTEDGLYDNYISQIQDDQQGALWIAANRGLFKVSIDELLTETATDSPKLRCRGFGRIDGLPSFQPGRDYSPDSCRGAEGKLYFSTSNGLLEVRPANFSESKRPPTVVLEKITLDGEVKAIYRSHSLLPQDYRTDLVNLSKANAKITLPPDHDRLVVNFAALSMGSPENVESRYRLSPMDSHWEEPSSKNNITFTRLPAGKYELQLNARNSEGTWDTASTTLTIVVEPFFWETWWFKIGGGLLTIAVTGGFVYLNLRRKHRNQLRELAAKRALEQERSRIARDIHDDLGASLTQISLLSQSSPSKESDRVLGQIQTTARHLMRSMDEVVWAINPEHDTFDDLANYLSSYAQEFLSVAEIRCRLELPMDLPEHSLSSQTRHNLFLAFKEALNNVVKYANASEVRISIVTTSESFVLKVTDNGGGIDANASADPSRPTAGNGLLNMKSRMKEIGGACTVTSSSESGTTLEFTIPFRQNR